MKTSNRVRRNNGKNGRSSQAAISTEKSSVQSRGAAAGQQTQTQPNGAGENADQFELVVFDKARGELNDTGAGITLSAGEWSAINQDATARGESINDWLQRVFNTNIPNPKAPKGTSPIVPASTSPGRIEMEDALNNLKSYGDAAVTLCILNGYSISNSISDQLRGYTLLFAEETKGISQLAEDVWLRFKRAFEAWQKDQLGVISGGTHSVETFSELSGAVRSLSYLLCLQGEIITNLDEPDDENSGALDCSLDTVKRLASAFSQMMKVSGSVRAVRAGGAELKRAA